MKDGSWPSGSMPLTQRPGTVPDVAYLEPPRDRFWADPFPLQRGDNYYIFFEEFLYDKRKAHISVMEMDASGECGEPQKILELDHHLSYPFIFAWNGETFMIPESKQAKCVSLYRCVSFPHRWELDRVLLDNVQAVDSTVHEYGGLWWLFCNIGGTHFPSNDELHLFWAPSPLGPWHAHTRNPVKTDVKSARPAGKLIQKNGSLYRPAQDCSVRMGGAISVNRILRLSEEEYEEVEVSRIEPTWRKGLLGVHTVNQAGRLTLLDCFGYVRKIL